MTSPNLTNVVWVKTILYSYRHIRPKKVKYPIPEIPDDSENKSGMDWVLPKIIGSGRVSGTRQALLMSPNVLLQCFRMRLSRLRCTRLTVIVISTTALAFVVLFLWNASYPFSWVNIYETGDNCFLSEFLIELKQCGCPRSIQRTSCR